MLEQTENMPKELKPKSVKVFWGMRKLEDLYRKPRNVFGDLNFTPVLSQADKMWTSARGHVQDIMMENHTNIENIWVYACGSDVMISASWRKLVNKGIKVKDFLSDASVVSGNKGGEK